MARRQNSDFSRLAAPLAFLLAATIAVLLVRSALHAGDESPAQENTAAERRDGGGNRQGRRPRQNPPPAEQETTETEAEAETDVETGTEAEEGTYHTVQPGDTLDAIAIQYGTTVEALLELNPGIDPRELRVSQRVRVA